MKICYVCNEYPPTPHGGIGTFVQTIAEGLAELGHEITVVGWGRSSGESIAKGVRVVTLPITGLPRMKEWSVRWSLCRWLDREALAGRIQIVETPEFSGPVPFRLHSCPVVVRLHLASTVIARHAGKRRKLLTYIRESLTLRHNRLWVPVSNFALDLTQATFGLRPSRYKVIYYPVCPPANTTAEVPTLPARYVLYAGTVSERKGAIQLAMAAGEFLAEMPEVHLVYAGPLAKDTHGCVDERIKGILGEELTQRVHFLGRLDRSLVLKLMQRAEVFAFPSTLETFGLVTAEAMLMGTPVVVCNVPPCTEFVEDGVTGILVPPGDTDALANAIVRLLRSQATAQSIGAAGAESVKEKFSLSRATTENLSLYAEEIARWNARA